MDQLMQFVQDRWILVVAALVALIVVVKVVKTVVKWIMVLAIAAGLLFYGANYMGDLKQISGKIINYSKEEAVKALVGEAKGAKYTENADGTFTVATDNIRLEGKKGSSEATITFYNQTFPVKLDETLKTIIEEVKQQNK